MANDVLPMEEMFSACKEVLDTTMRPWHYVELTRRGLKLLGQDEDNVNFKRQIEDIREKMLEAEWRGTVFYVGQPYCLGAVKHWFQRELFQQETWVIPASITGAINGTFEALMRNPFLLQKVQAASIDSVYRARARGLQIEFTVKEWFKKNWPKLYLPPENEGKFSQPCNHDFRLRINGKSIDVDISGPNKNGKHGNSAGKNPADYHLLCDIAHDGQNVEWLGVVNKSHYQPDLSLEITGSPVKMIVWLNCIQAGLNYDVLRKAAYGIKSNAN